MERGGTVVVPSRQRAAALRLAHSAAMLSAGRQTWATPDILAWNVWLERGLSEARARLEPVPRRLSSLDDRLLWRAAVCEAAANRQILSPERLTDAVRRAARLLEDYGISLPDSGSPEAALLLAARDHYRRRCRELGVLGSHSWTDCRAYLRPSEQVLLAGFDAIGSARRHWLEQHGAAVFDPSATATPSASATGGQVRLAGYADATQEAEAAAEWCAVMLTQDPGARLLLVVPRLGEQRHLWQRALSQRLDYEAILGDGGESAYAIEGGAPLAGYPLVAAALHLVAFAAAEAQFEQFSALLRSPYLAALDRAACLQLDVWLREQNIDAATPAVLATMTESAAAPAGPRAAATIGLLLEAVAAMAAVAAGGAEPARGSEPARPAAPAHAAQPSNAGAAPRGAWARAFATLLAHCGWPGEHPLDSEQQQVRMRFDELLGELGATDALASALSLVQANALLQELAAGIAFEPATDDVAVTVTGRLEDPIVHYDGVWVAGLSADAWPPAARPDPLIPLALQYSAGMPGVSAAAQLQRSRELQQQWQRAGGCCVLSWSASAPDLPADPSPLLLQIAVPALTLPALEPPAQGFRLEQWLAQAAPPLAPWMDTVGPAWATERALRGGTRLLQLQSLCPFRSFAELRLSARALSSPQPGLDPRQRGRLLHRALELFWLQLGDSVALQALSDDAARAIARRCVADATEQFGRGQPAHASEGFEVWLLAREAERTHELMAHLIGWERSRAEHFVTHALEWSHPLPIAGTTLSLRLDRIDRLDDGRLIIIDYKSGSVEAFDADAARPPQPQLPAYAGAAAAEGPLAAVLAVYLGREGVTVRGVADRRDRIRRLPVPPAGEADWPALLQRWRERLQRLGEEFLRGHAAVAPQPGACEWCHLHGLCRIEDAA